MSQTTMEARGAGIEEGQTGAAWEAFTGPVARVLLAVPFGVFGLLHLVGARDMAGMVPAWVPGGGVLWVVLTGLAMIAASVSLATGWLARWSGPLLATLVGIFVVTLHLPGLADEASAQMALMSILKDTGLIGGALLAANHAVRR